MIEHDASPAAPPASRWLMVNLLAVVGYGLIAMSLCLPSMASWSASFGVEQDFVQLSFSAFVLGFGGAQLFYGPLSDRHGRRVVLLVGLGLAVAGSLVCALAPTMSVLVGGRLLQGIGAAAGMVIGRAMVQDFFGGHDRARVMAFIGMVMGFCPPTGMIVGGQLHVHLGWRFNFLLAASIAFVLLISVWRTLPRTRPERDSDDHWLRDLGRAYAKLGRIPAYLLYCTILSMCTGSFYIFLAGMPVVLANYGVGPGEIGWYIIAPPLSYIIGNFVTSRLLARTTEMRIMFVGHVLTLFGIGTVLAFALGGVYSPVAVAAPLVLLGLGHGLVMPPTLAGTVSVLPALAGAAAAGGGVAQQFSGAFAGYIVGLFPHDTAAVFAVLMMAFMAVSLLAQLVLVASSRLRLASHH